MPLEPELQNAIKEVVEEMGQPDKVSARLIAWIEAMSDSEIALEDQQSFLEKVKDALEIEEEVPDEN